MDGNVYTFGTNERSSLGLYRNVPENIYGGIGEEPKVKSLMTAKSVENTEEGRKQMSRLKRIISELIIISMLFTSIPMVFADVEKNNESSVSEEQVINEETENNLIEEKC